MSSKTMTTVERPTGIRRRNPSEPFFVQMLDNLEHSSNHPVQERNLPREARD